MNATASVWPSTCLCGLLALGGCAAKGPSYGDFMANADPTAGDAVRIFFLRPRDADDGSNGGAASIKVNQELVGRLRYGGFFYVDIAPGTTALASSGRFRTLGACEIDITTSPGSRVYIDVGPRLSYMIAGAVGGAVGGVAGAAAVPSAYGGAGAAVATSAAGIATGSAAGTAAATVVDGKGKRCRGPLKLELLAEEDALARLTDLTWSGD